MANALQFSGGSAATFPNAWLFGPGLGVGAIEFYIKTTTANQVLLSQTFNREFTYGGYGITGSIGQAIWLDQNGFINLTQGYAVGNRPITTLNNYVGRTSVIDGNWHLISVYSDFNNFYYYIDGTADTVTAQNQPTPLMAASPVSSVTSLGLDTYFPTPVAPAYTGLMSELRFWAGGNPQYVLTPAFSLNVGVPVSVSTPNLQGYWPLWTNQATPLVDLVAHQTLALGSATIVSNQGQYYDDVSEVLCNGQMQAFNLFTSGTTGAAFNYLLSQIGMTNYTPTTFRQLYTQQAYEFNFQGWANEIKGVPYPANEQNFTQADFTTVQGILFTELSATATVWGVYTQAMDSLNALTAQYTLAASTVYTTLFSGNASLSTTVTSDAGLIVSIVASVASLIPDVGTAVSAAIKVAWAIAGFFQSAPQAPINYQASLAVEGQASNLDAALNAALQNLTKQVQGSVAILLQDAGLLSLIQSRVLDGQGFVYGANLTTDTQTNSTLLNAAYNGAVLQFSQFVLTGAFPMYVYFMNQYGGYDVTVNFINNAPMFYYGWGQGIDLWGQITFGGQLIVGYIVQDGNNGWPNCESLGMPDQDLIANAASALNNQSVSLQELVSWNWTVVNNATAVHV